MDSDSKEMLIFIASILGFGILLFGFARFTGEEKNEDSKTVQTE